MPGRVFHHIAFRVQHGPPDGERTLSEHRLQPRSLVHEQAALHHHRCTQELGVHREHDLSSVAGKDGPHHGSGSSITAIVEDNHKVVEIQSQTRQHLRDQRSSKQWWEISRVVEQAPQCEAVDEEASSWVLDSLFSDQVVEVVADVQLVPCLRPTEIHQQGTQVTLSTVAQRCVRFFTEARRQLILRGKSKGPVGGTSGTCCSGTRPLGAPADQLEVSGVTQVHVDANTWTRWIELAAVASNEGTMRLRTM